MSNWLGQSRRLAVGLLVGLLGGDVSLFAADPAPAPAPPPAIQDLSLPELARTGQSLVAGGQYQDAIAYLKEFIRVLAKNVDEKMRPLLEMAHLQLGICYLETQQFGPAEEAFQACIQQFPNGLQQRPAHLLLAATYTATQQWQKVIDTLRAMLQLGTPTAGEKLAANQMLGEAFFELDDWDNAVTPLRSVFATSPDQTAQSEAASMATICYARRHRWEELFAFLPQVYETSARFDIRLNLTLIESGDDSYADKRYPPALLMYRLVYSRAELLGQIDQRIADTKSFLENVVKTIGIDRARLAAARQQATRQLARYEEQRTDLQQMPEYAPGLNLRLAQTYVQLHRYWEGLLLFRSVYDADPKHELAEQALYSAFTTAVLLGNYERAFAEGYEYVGAYPKGQFWDVLTLTLAELHIERQDYEAGLRIAEKGVAVNPQHEMIDQMIYLMGYCLFYLERFEPALEKFGQLVKDYPQSYFRESGEYWHALTHLFLTHYEDAAREFLAFNARYPKGPYSEDTAYRVGVAQYGGGEFTAAAASLKKFVEAWPKSALQAEALSMLGDIHASWSELNIAQAYYRQATGKATSMFQINYATFQSARVYELEQHHEQIIQLFRDYQQRYGEKGNYTEAAYWIGNAQMALGRRADAWQTFFDAIRDHGNKPANYGIDMIIRDFIAEAEQAAGLEDRAPFLDRLSRELDKARADGRRTLELRLVALFAATAKTTALRDQLLTTILREENIPVAGPITLNLMAEHARRRGQTALARKINEYFLKHHATSDLALPAYQALAELELADGKPAAAVPLLQELATRFATTPEAATAQKRLGDVYRELKQWDLAIAAYQAVLGVKDWRGPLWPESLYGLGLCHLDQGQVTEAFAYFQRLYVLYDGYPEWVARAYLKSGECLEKLQRRAEATRTYQEMLGKETLAGRPELTAARDALGRLGGGG